MLQIRRNDTSEIVDKLGRMVDKNGYIQHTIHAAELLNKTYTIHDTRIEKLMKYVKNKRSESEIYKNSGARFSNYDLIDIYNDIEKLIKEE